VAIDHVRLDPFIIGPNPATVGSPIRFHGAINGVGVTDQLGRNIPYSVSGNSLSILAGPGVYVVTMQRGGTVRSVRIVLQ